MVEVVDPKIQKLIPFLLYYIIESMNKLIVIRHSERLDEVDKAQWKHIVLQHSLRSEKNDGSSRL